MSLHFRSSANAQDATDAARYISAELAALAPRIGKRALLDLQITALRKKLHSTPNTAARAHVGSSEETPAAYVELARLEHERADLAQVEARAASLTAELAAIRPQMAQKRRLPNLDAISVAAPCHANWDDMVGTDTARHCRACDKKVFNLSAMTRVEAETFLEAQLVAPCIRFYRRTDGTLLTQDCPVGVKRRKRRRTFAAIGLALAALGDATFWYQPELVVNLVGALARPMVRIFEPRQRYIADAVPPQPYVVGSVATPDSPPPSLPPRSVPITGVIVTAPAQEHPAPPSCVGNPHAGGHCASVPQKTGNSGK